MYDVAIIGAGVVGAMIARELAAYRLKICILEKESDVAMGATKANSAIVHAGFDAAEGSLKARLNVKGSQMMPAVTKALGVKYRQNGSIVVGFNEEDRAMLQQLLARGRANGVADLALLEREELLRLEPHLSDGVICGLHAPTGGIVCPYELTVAAVGNAMDNGAAFLRNFAVESIADCVDYYEISAGETSVQTRFVVNAAGVYSDAVARMVGDTSFTVHPRRGEYLLLDKECGDLVSHTVFMTPGRMGKGLLVTPTVDGNLLIGPTAVDTDDKENTATTQAFFASVFDAAGRSVRDIPRNKTITSFCGLRAVGDTGDFIINVPKPRFVNAAGIESPGLSASPAIAEYVRDLLAGEGLSLEKKPDHIPTRRPMHAFRTADLAEKNRMIRENPAYGRVVCRCEGVTEGEILDALRTEPRPLDLDGVKRRTRAQMGRCQGGFCSPTVLELLVRELGASACGITKSGKGSRVILGRTKEDAE